MDNLTLASLRRVSRRGVIGRSWQRSLSTKQVEDLDIRPPRLERPVRLLSGGNQQKVVFGKWLIHGARVQILDEPTRGVDVATKVQIYRIMADLAERGLGVLLISSDLPEIIGMSDRILVMRLTVRARVSAGEYESACYRSRQASRSWRHERAKLPSTGARTRRPRAMDGPGAAHAASAPCARHRTRS
jgi:ABC-type sugar transport system ATPase subunit